jgi:hypothetical protein
MLSKTTIVFGGSKGTVSSFIKRISVGMDLLGKHRVTFDGIRALAIQCHALDISAYHLLLDSTLAELTERTKACYEELFTGQLLALAIALRTKFYQGADHKATVTYVSDCGILFKYKRGPEKTEETEETVVFSIKDICDKIIHADSIFRCLDSGVEKPTTTIKGRDTRNQSEWELSISISLFAEGVLNWIDSFQES